MINITDIWKWFLKNESKNTLDELYCHTECPFMTLWESEQCKSHKPHICKRYHNRLYHLKSHPNLIKLPSCNL